MNLLACDNCARQYDVTHLEVGALIRCACDQVAAVPARKPLSVTALACNHCGGAVRPDDQACPYCEAALDQAALQSTTLCPKCFTRIPDDARHCNGCGIEIRPQPLTPIPDGKACPRCQGKLQIRSLEVTDVIECAECQGIWVRSNAFQSICRDAVLNGKVPLPEWPQREEPKAQSGSFYIACLTCDQMMQRRQYKHNSRPTGVIIDLCRDHGVWLDHRELESISEHLRSIGGAVEPLFERETSKVPDKIQLSMNTPNTPRTFVEGALEFVISLLTR